MGKFYSKEELAELQKEFPELNVQRLYYDVYLEKNLEVPPSLREDFRDFIRKYLEWKERQRQKTEYKSEREKQQRNKMWKWFRRRGQKAKMKKSDIPQEIRLKFGEPAVTDPAAEEEVEIVSEVDPESVKVRYRGEIFPVNKKQLKYGEKNALKPIRLMSDSELMKEYTRLKTFDEGRLFRYRLKRIEKEIERRGIDKYNTKEATTNFSLPSGIAGLLLEDGEKCAWIANATENGKKEKQKEENQTQRSKKSTRRFSVWDVLDGQIIRSGKLVK